MSQANYSLLNRLFTTTSPIALSVGLSLAIVSVTEAAGWYNMPTSVPQCIGLGYGPGYHAPMVLGPRLASGKETKRISHVSRAPTARACFTDFGASSCCEFCETMAARVVGTTQGAVQETTPAISPGYVLPSNPVLAPPQVDGIYRGASRPSATRWRW